MPAPTFVDTSQAVDTGSPASIACPLPVGAQAGDLMIATLYNDIGNSVVPSGNWQEIAAGGWSHLMSFEASQGRDQWVGIMYKIHTGSEGTPTFQSNGNDATTSAIITAFRSFDPAIWDVIYSEGSHTTDVADDASPTPAPITTQTADALVFIFGCVSHDDINAWNTSPGYTLADEIVATQHAQQATQYKEVPSAGTETPGEWATTNTGDTGEATCTTLAIKALAGPPTGATWAGPLDTPADADVSAGNATGRMRAALGVTVGLATTPSYKWQASHEGGAYFDITPSSSVIRTVSTVHFNDGDDCDTQLLGGGTFIGTNAAAESASGTFVMPVDHSVGASIETELSYEVVAADVADTDVIVLRLVLADGTLLDTYTAEPTLNVVKTPAGSFVDLAGSIEGVGTITGTGEVLGTVDLAGSIEGVGTITGTMVKEQILELAGSIEGVGDIAGTLTKIGAVELAGSIEGVGDIVGTGEVLGTVDLAGSIEGVGDIVGTGEVLGTVDLAGSIEGVGDIVGTLQTTRDVDLAGSIEGVGTIAGTMEVSGIVDLAGSIEGTGDLAGTLVKEQILDLAGSIEGVGDIVGTGEVLGTVDLAGSIEGVGDITGTLGTLGTVDLAGSIEGVGTIAGTMDKAGPVDLAGSIEGVGTITGAGDVLGVVDFAGSIEGVGTVVGNMDKGGPVLLAGRIEGVGDITGTLLKTSPVLLRATEPSVVSLTPVHTLATETPERTVRSVTPKRTLDPLT